VAFDTFGGNRERYHAFSSLVEGITSYFSVASQYTVKKRKTIKSKAHM
jgi:hypothetical protein